MAALVAYLMLCDELTSTAGTEVILFAIAFFPVSGYVLTMAMGTPDVYGYLHDFIVRLAVPLVFIRLSYFVDHHRMFYTRITIELARKSEVICKAHWKI